MRNFQDDPDFYRQQITECLVEAEDEFKEKLDEMVKRFRQAQNRQREERQKKINAVKPHFDRMERVMSNKRDMEASKNYQSLNTYIQNQQKKRKHQRSQERNKQFLLQDKKIKASEQIKRNVEKRKFLHQEYLQKCKEYNN